MTGTMSDASVHAAIARVYREESSRALATLIRLLGDFDAAEEALQEAFATAVVQWERDGVPSNPRAWLISTGRNRMIDRIRRDQRFVRATTTLGFDSEIAIPPVEPADDDSGVDDDQLRLIFTCCHPALA